MNKNVKSVLLIGGLLAVFAVITLLSNRQFHNQSFSGTVDSAYRGRKSNAFYIVIDGYSHEFDVLPLSAAPAIDKIVAKGDSLYKKQNTDTVVLVHQKKYVFKYVLNRGIFPVKSK